MITCQIPSCQAPAVCQCNRIRAAMNKLLRRQSQVNVLRPAARARHRYIVEALKGEKS